MGRFISALFLVFILFFLISRPALAYYTNMPASLVIGQTDFGAGSSGVVSQSTFGGSIRTVFVDPKGRVIIPDENNNRILIWNKIPTTNGAPADLVLGQPDFVSSTANNGGRSASTLSLPTVAFSDGDRLFVTDDGNPSNNSRVLIWNTFPTVNQQPADIVVGQADMTSIVTTCDNVHMSQPNGVWIYQNKLFISDTSHNRVLIWNHVPTTNGVAADIVLGQTSFNSCGAPGSPTQSNLSSPRHVIVDQSGRMFVNDRSQNRVLVWNTIPTINNQNANMVLGQSDFFSKITPSPPGANTVNVPFAFSSDSRVFVGDVNNRRVLIFNSIPVINGASADIVLGQPDFVSNANNGVSANSYNPGGVPFEYKSQLFVPDPTNSRVLIFNNIIATPEISMTGISKTNDFKMKFSGNIKMGEALHYDLGAGGGVSFSVNGNDGSGVNSVGNSVNDGNGSLYYDFSNTFEPWTGSNGTKEDWTANFDNLRSTRGFTVKVTSRNSNTDSSHIFYFEPFNMVSLTAGTVTLSVNKYQIQRIKDNIDHFEIETKKEGETWKPYLTNISTTNINAVSGIVTAVPSNTLPIGNYQVRAVSVSKDSNWRQNSNTISLNLTSIIPAVTYINPGNYTQTTGQWFPLQLNSLTPNINGISFSNTTVAIRVTNQTTGVYKDYYTTTNSSSHFIFPPVIYTNSLLTVSTYDTNGRYTTLPPIQISANFQ